ncbi:hypothetical protein EDD22DRAFT_231157 [Suillus occidentalis]|nr:hypothetical protein EDD22DRAFT_231157 [Suillus occidentalis]
MLLWFFHLSYLSDPGLGQRRLELENTYLCLALSLFSAECSSIGAQLQWPPSMGPWPIDELSESRLTFSIRHLRDGKGTLTNGLTVFQRPTDRLDRLNIT